MSLPRIYQPTTLKISPTLIRLDEKASHHLIRVLRLGVGDFLIIFNGQGGEYTAVIKHINKKSVAIELLSFSPREVESPLTIALAQGIARGEKMDFIVQKAVELGVNRIIPLVTEYSNVRLTKDREIKRQNHWQAIAISACEQSGRNRIPLVTVPVNFSVWLANQHTDYLFVLSPHHQQKLPERIPSSASITLLIGPEGGLSLNEMDSAIQRGFMPLQLGPRILRTETASLTAITVLQSRYGDLT